MEVENGMSPMIYSFLPLKVIFHFHDYGRKSNPNQPQLDIMSSQPTLPGPRTPAETMAVL